jgi:hypothetical protein
MRFSSFQSPARLAIFTMLMLSIPAFAATTVEVGTCISGLVQFPTIQNAVTQSPAGTIIEVCPGSYAEQVSINKNLTLKGVADPNSNQDAAIIVAPSGGVVANAASLSSGQPIAAQILVVSPATSVAISSLTVDGTGNNLGDCSINLIGVYFQNASGSVSTSVLRNQALAPSLSGCQDGLGAFVQSGGGGTSTVTIQTTSVHNYDKNGITGNESGTTLNAISDVVQGAGVVAPPGSAQNGIQLGFGATGKVTGNTVLDQIYGDITSAISVGILLYDAAENSSIKVSSNNVDNTQTAVGIYTDSSDPTEYGDGVTVQSNNIFETLNYDAIDVCTNGNTIKSNTIANSAESGVHLDASCSGGTNTTGNGNSVNGNIMLESGCAGVLEDSGTTNTVGTEVFIDIPSTILNGACPVAPGTRLGKGFVKGTRFKAFR